MMVVAERHRHPSPTTPAACAGRKEEKMKNYIKIDNCLNCQHHGKRVLNPLSQDDTAVIIYCSELERELRTTSQKWLVNGYTHVYIPDDCPYINKDEE